MIAETLDFSEIYPNVHSTIEIRHMSEDSSWIPCVFGVLDSEIGREIEDEMLEWLLPEYDVWCIIQPEPGLLFEYPALRFAQWLIQKQSSQEYLLYVHTKGAFFKNPTQKRIRQLWKREFTGPEKSKYISVLNAGADVACPLTGPQKQTWFNGMFISGRSLNSIPLITPQKDRYVFQRLFCQMDVRGILSKNISQDILTETVLNLISSDTKTAVQQVNDYSVSLEWKPRHKKKK